MKNVAAILLLTSGPLFFAQNLKMNYDWRNANNAQRREAIQKMTPEERIKLLKQYRENAVVSDLAIAPEKQQDFKRIFEEYQQSQKGIREQFRPDFQAETLSDEEAKKRLDQSFVVGQQLLDNRRKFSQKFLQILSPQQVLKLYQNEGKMRDKVLQRNRSAGGNTTTKNP